MSTMLWVISAIHNDGSTHVESTNYESVAYIRYLAMLVSSNTVSVRLTLNGRLIEQFDSSNAQFIALEYEHAIT